MAKVRTHGGEFSTDAPGYYIPNPNKKGCKIKLMFTPMDPVLSPKIGLVQSVISQKNGARSDTGDATRQAEQDKRSLTPDEEKHEGASGRKIDRAAEKNNPMYGAQNAGDDVKDLGASGTGGNAHYGKREKNPTGVVETDAAWLTDGPQRNARGVTSMQIFETAALALEGDMSGTYLGTVKWGYNKDTSENVTLVDLAVISMGVPTASWMKAAEKWNKTKTNVGGTDKANLQLPIANHETKAAPTTKPQISKRLIELRAEISKLDRSKDATTIKNIEFEIKVLEGRQAELDKTGTG